LVGRDHGLGVVSTLRAEGTIHSSVVNGVAAHAVDHHQDAQFAF